MYKKCYQGKKLDHNLYEMHLWEEDGKHQVVEYKILLMLIVLNKKLLLKV